MNKKAKIATITALVIAISIVALMVYAAPKKCSNGVDDDNDGLVDYPNDPGCSGSQDNTETNSALVCDNSIDETNDADTLADYRLSGGDAGCTSPTDNNERDGLCDDLSDNDGDAKIDFTNVNGTADPECGTFADVEHECSDTDNGEVTVQGTTSGSFGGTPFNSTDSCVDAVTLIEYYCSPYNLGSQNVSCVMNQTTSCSNGACI